MDILTTILGVFAVAIVAVFIAALVGNIVDEATEDDSTLQDNLKNNNWEDHIGPGF